MAAVINLLSTIVNQHLPLPYPNTSFTDKTIIVTGSNTGLGLEAARHFTRLGAQKVILAVRNLEKGETAKKSIEESTNRMNTVECWKLDMSNFKATIEFIERVQTLSRLDVVVLNAGVGAASWRDSPDGWEESLQVNVLSTALLAIRLLPKMVESGKRYPGWIPRMVVVSSEVHRWSTVVSQHGEWPDEGIMEFLNDRNRSGKDMAGRYPVTKLFDIYIMGEMARLAQVGGGGNGVPGVIVNSISPGLCYSELGRELGWGHRVLCFFLARSTEKGSRTLVDAASRGKDTHGGYMDSCKLTRTSELVTSDEGIKTQKRVWSEILDILEDVSPGVKRLAGC